MIFELNKSKMTQFGLIQLITKSLVLDSMSSMSFKGHNFYIRSQNDMIPLGDKRRHPELSFDTKITQKVQRARKNEAFKFGPEAVS